MESKSESIDILTITAALRDNGDLESVGGAYYITELTSNVHSSAHIKKHSMILFEYAIKRFFYELGMTMISESQKFETSAPELIERF